MENLVNTSIEQEVLAYLHKTSKHLFITETGEAFYKVLPYRKDDEWYYVAIMTDGHETTIWGNKLDYYIDRYGKNAKNVISSSLFPEHYFSKMKAIPNFKEMKEKMYQVHKDLSNGVESTDWVKHLLGIEPKK